MIDRMSNLDFSQYAGEVDDPCCTVSHHRAAETCRDEAIRARKSEDVLFQALAFAASAIKSGEPWSPTCEEVIGKALRGEK
jgi:hypothetical protein